MPDNKKPIAIDLFSGVGGLTEGLRQAGFRVLGAIENDPFACLNYQLNHPNVKVWQNDIRKVTGPMILESFRLRRGELDLLAACPPCQGFSRMRTKNGTRACDDERNDLIFEVLRIVRSTRPKALMLENVPGLADDARFKKFVNSLTREGYQLKWQVLNVADFAVPQNRRRLVLIGSRISDPQFAPAESRKTTVREHIGKLEPPSKSNDAIHNYPVVRSPKVAALIRRIPRNGGSRSSLGDASQLKCHQGFRGFWDVYGRMAWNEQAPTITGGCINPSKGRFIHPVANRAITLREAALLQTFPQGYRFTMVNGRYAVALLIGNALPPQFIKRHASALRKSAI